MYNMFVAVRFALSVKHPRNARRRPANNLIEKKHTVSFKVTHTCTKKRQFVWVSFTPFIINGRWSNITVVQSFFYLIIRLDSTINSIRNNYGKEKNSCSIPKKTTNNRNIIMFCLDFHKIWVSLSLSLVLNNSPLPFFFFKMQEIQNLLHAPLHISIIHIIIKLQDFLRMSAQINHIII